MAVTTNQFTLNTDDWTVITTNAANSFVQILSDGPVLVYAGGTTKPAATSFTGILLSQQSKHLQALQLVGLVAASDVVYARGRRAGEVETVVVVTS